MWSYYPHKYANKTMGMLAVYDRIRGCDWTKIAVGMPGYRRVAWSSVSDRITGALQLFAKWERNWCSILLPLFCLPLEQGSEETLHTYMYLFRREPLRASWACIYLKWKLKCVKCQKGYRSSREGEALLQNGAKCAIAISLHLNGGLYWCNWLMSEFESPSQFWSLNVCTWERTIQAMTGIAETTTSRISCEQRVIPRHCI